MTYPEFQLLEAPADASPEQIKDIVAANTAILDYRQKIDDLEIDVLERQKTKIDLEVAEIELAKKKHWASRDVDAYRYRSGVFTLYDYVDDYSCKQVINDITVWHSITPKGTPLQLNINSYGGSVTDGFALFDTLRYVAEDGDRKVKTVNLGVAASMGGILLQAGDERVVTPSSILMIHEVSYGVGGSAARHRDTMDMSDILAARIIEVFSERSNLTPDEFKDKWDRRDWWLSAADALKFGFADRVAFS
jgi:ATP-dependent Clp endopeptidase proteolytic subunit ClpP